MFTIEYVVIQGRASPGVVERATCAAADIADAAVMARSGCREAQWEQAIIQPDAYQILDDDGNVVFRSWEMARSLPSR